jgi:hypothetical protein
MHRSAIKADKFGTRKLDPEKARALATGIGQSGTAAFINGQVRSMRVEGDMPESQRKMLCADSGYPKPMADPMVSVVMSPSKKAAVTRTLR